MFCRKGELACGKGSENLQSVSHLNSTDARTQNLVSMRGTYEWHALPVLNRVSPTSSSHENQIPRAQHALHLLPVAQA